MSRKRVIVVTGVSRGLGLAMAEGFLAAGHKVAGCARDSRAIDALCEQWPDLGNFASVDVANGAAVRRWANLVTGAFGTPDLLINNAALINLNAPLWEVPAEEFSRVVDVNIKGVANVIRHFVPEMAARRRGVIVNLSSYWGRSVAAEVAPYCATKWAIEGLTAALAEELPRGMAAVSLNPGIIDTDMLRSCFGASAGQYPNAARWAKKAVPFILSLTAEHNGKQLTVPT